MAEAPEGTALINTSAARRSQVRSTGPGQAGVAVVVAFAARPEARSVLPEALLLAPYPGRLTAEPDGGHLRVPAALPQRLQQVAFEPERVGRGGAQRAAHPAAGGQAPDIEKQTHQWQ